jgi:hypothetical protein
MFESGANWFGASKRAPRVVGLYARHYSSKKNNKGIAEWLSFGITPPGAVIVLLTSDARALFVWLKQKYHANDQEGVNCVVFRNEGNVLSSTLILEAESFAWSQWPAERLFTYVDPKEVSSRNPGYCFKMAGWELVRDANGLPLKTARGLLVFEKLPEPAAQHHVHGTAERRRP